MAFEDSSNVGTSGSRYLGEGFRQEPDFRETTTPAVPVAAGQIVTIPETTVTLPKRATPNLEYVFDDPADGEPGRDRMLVHGLWELVLAIAVAGLAYLLYRSAPSLFSGAGLRTLLLSVTTLGVAVVASALALRAAVPNLAVGAVAVAAGIHFGQHAGSGLLTPLLAVIGLAATVGAVQGLLVVGLHVPAWAASIGAVMAMLIWSGSQAPVVFADGYDPAPHAYWWFAGFCVLSLVSAVVGLVPSVRRAVGGFRPVADPAQRRRPLAAVLAFAATVGSSVLAGVAGVLAVCLHGAVSPSDGLPLTAAALGAALLGGTSAFGRRGGIFGTILATGLVAVATEYAARTHPSWSAAIIPAVAVGLGLAVTRLVERYGRPSAGNPDEADDDWSPRVQATTSAWSAGRAYQPPAQQAVGGIWASDDAWGTTER